MSQEDMIDPAPARQIIAHFSQKTAAERSVEEDVAYAYLMRQQREEAEAEYRLVMERVKAAFKVDGITEKKKVLGAGDYDLVVTKRKPSCGIDWERWALDIVGAEAVKEIEATLALVKDGKADSPYIVRGKEVTAVEIVKRTPGDYPL